MKTQQTAISYPERSRCAPVLHVRESVVTFHWCSVYLHCSGKVPYFKTVFSFFFGELVSRHFRPHRAIVLPAYIEKDLDSTGIKPSLAIAADWIQFLWSLWLGLSSHPSKVEGYLGDLQFLLKRRPQNANIRNFENASIIEVLEPSV